ncbi:MAG TPA: beta-ketoacyl synthase N-terminal-like domain-containing protein [Pyrinomonadaceae bacterium]|nr:beta-ketoacyl synthase N-terminal-like domain-containing protein [Pyrinomonadaceae bacterium]
MSGRQTSIKPEAGGTSPERSTDAAGRPLSARQLQDWLVSQVGELAEVAPERIDPSEPFTTYGLTSMDAVGMSGDLEELLGLTLSPTLLYEHPSIESLAAHLSGEAGDDAPSIEDAAQESGAEAVAIVGIGCRFPGAPSTSAFWQLLRDGIDAVTELPAARRTLTGGDDSGAPRGGFLERPEQFDADFFRISPREAERMDPQQRILLEVAWEALEDAGLLAQSLRRTRTGVFVGLSNSDYSGLLSGEPSLIDAYTGTGNARSIAANRLSYFFDFRGPSMTVDTACSSSLVAVHLACRSLLNAECTLAVAGGGNLILSEEVSLPFSKAGLLAADGRCKAFDERADGYVRGEGFGVVVLKRLSQAVADGDPVYAVILGSEVNQDGRTNGITSPSAQAQEALLREAYRRAGVSPGAVQYVEAHGSGTLLGDRIEAQALGAVLAEGRPEDRPCLVGSVKTNLGHLEAAAGVAGLIKVALALKHRELPPSLHFETPNPHIRFDQLPLRVQRGLAPWPNADGGALAGVSSFGFGGTNAHVVVASAPGVPAPDSRTRPRLLPLSARTPAGLEDATANLVAYLKRDAAAELGDVAFTLQTGRSDFAHRRFAVCGDTAEASASFESKNPARVTTGVAEEPEPEVAFMFPGVGEHYVGMAAELYRHEPTFRAAFDRCCELLPAGRELRDLIFGTPDAPQTPAQGAGLDLRRLLKRGEAGEGGAALNRTQFSQPAVFVVEYALAQLLMSWGIRPHVMLGYSVGEYVAACVAGVLSLEDALAVVSARARMIESLPAGAMLAVILPQTEVEELLTADISVAVDNGAAGRILAGPPAAIDALEQRLRARGAACQRLQTGHAFHTPMMSPLYEEMAGLMRGVTLNAPQTPYLSNVTGTWITADEATDPYYWARHLCQTVRFGENVGALLDEPRRLLLEVGPGLSLITIVRQHLGAAEAQSPRLIPTLPPSYLRQPDSAFLLNAVGQVWLAGGAVDWAGLNQHDAPRRVTLLPTYPFERRGYWLGSHAPARPAQAGKKTDPADWFYLPTWRETLPPAARTSQNPSPSSAAWLVFSDACGLGAEIVRRLNESGATVVTVEPGDCFGRHGEHRYSLNPSEPEDYRRLMKELAASGSFPGEVVHLWGVSRTAEASFDEAQRQGFYSLVYLSRSLAEIGPATPVRLKVVSNNLHEVSGDEEVCPERATVLGACRVIPQEYPHITCRSIDLALAPRPAPTDGRLADRLFNELTTQTADHTVAYRGARRWVQSFEPVRLEAAAEGASGRLRDGGVYLITGGLGDMGLAFAEAMVRRASARLVLTSRAGLPARAEWDGWLAERGEQDATSQRILKVRELEELGAEVLVLGADVADERRMREVVEETLATFGGLHGVVHGAGLISADSFAMLHELERATCEQHFRAKAHGLLVVERLTRGLGLDFHLLLSSLSCYLGGLGFAPYAAGNVFMDAFARRRNRAGGTPWLCVNWEAWQSREEKMLGSLRAGGWEASVNEFQVTADEGTDVFLRVMSADNFTHLVNSTGDMKTRIERWMNPERARAGSAAAATKAVHPRPQLSAAYVGPRDEVEATLAGILQQLLGVEQVGVHDNFFELGGDSILSIQFTARANQAGFRLNPKQLLGNPTVAELAAVIGAQASAESEPDATNVPLPLTPHQQRLLEQDAPALNQLSRAVLLEVAPSLTPVMLGQAVQHLLARHDALRLCFRRAEAGWQQVIQALDGDAPLSLLNPPDAGGAEREEFIRRAADELRSELDPTAGRLMRAAHFRFGGESSDSFLLVIHPLAADDASWRILLEDFESVCRSLTAGEPIAPRPATTSFVRWAHSLSERANSIELAQEADFWSAATSSASTPLTRDFEGAHDASASRSVSVSLGVGETEALLGEVPRAYRASVEEALLTCLSWAVTRRAQTPSLLVELEGCGRYAAPEGADLTHTAGCFTHTFPALLETGRADTVGGALKIVKETLRRIPGRGLSYGLLRRTGGDATRAEVGFKYADPSEGIRLDSPLLRVAEQSNAPGGGRYPLEVAAVVAGGRLQLVWTYEERVHGRASVEAMAEDCAGALRSLVEHRQSPETAACTPSDFPLAQLDARRLGKVSALIEKLERGATLSARN